MNTQLIEYILKKAGEHADQISSWVSIDGEVVDYHVDQIKEILQMIAQHLS